MKKCFLLIISILILFPLSSGNYNATSDAHSAVVINLPTDNSLNGYRTESSQSSAQDGEMPDRISVSETEPGSGGAVTLNGNYVGNKNSRVFHKPSCSSIKKAKKENKIQFKDRSEAIAQGYSPCKRCNP